MQNYLLVSSDSHAGLPMRQYRSYLEKKYLPEFDEWILTADRLPSFDEMPERGIILEAHLHRWTKSDPVCEEIRARASGAWDINVRIKEMNAEGIAAEVVFPDGQFNNDFPFGGFFGNGKAELRVAGAKAHNRWLAEFCSYAPDRFCGLAMIMPFDIEDTVAEVRRAHAEGLRGILLSTHEHGLRLFHNRCYDPLWAVCAELDMPVHLHAGERQDIYEGFDLQTIPIFEQEEPFFRQRTLVHLILSGAFVRHPRLRFVVAEMGMDWIPAALDRLEHLYGEVSMLSGMAPKSRLGLSPWRCWTRNCAVAATFASSEEMKVWSRLGSDTVMWGTDYPHVEAAWPQSLVELRNSFAGVPEIETRKMVGLNAARIYNFDLTALAPIVEEIGPPAGSLTSDKRSADGIRYGQEDYDQNRVFAQSFHRNLERAMNLDADVLER